MKIFSWNVNGLRSVINKGALQQFITEYRPDILCIQETKAKQGQAEIDLIEYEEIWNSAERPGYSGTAIFTKIKPISVNYSLPTGQIFADEFGDPLSEGRIITAECDKFFLVNVYTPKSKRALERLGLRERLWDPAVLDFIKELEKSKPVIMCGDFNAAHTEIDLARPETNHHNADFTDEERSGVTNIIKSGFIDTFRALHPDERRYTWWSHMANARARNIGWRIDYFFISDALKENLKSAEIYENVTGSDHCPISVDMEF